VVEPIARRGFIRVPELRKQLDEAFMDRQGDVVLELNAVRHLDAVAIAVIAITSDRMRESGRQLVVQGISPRQERSMRRKGLLIPAPRFSSDQALKPGRRSSAS
jgi:anti-anti-sigma factor